MNERQGKGKNPTYALRDRQGSVMTNMDEIVALAEGVYRDIYNSLDNQDNCERGNSLEEADIPPILTEEIMKALKEMQAGKAPGEDLNTADLSKDGGQIMLEKMASLIRNA